MPYRQLILCALALALGTAACQERMAAQLVLKPGKPYSRSRIAVFPLQNLSESPEAAPEVEAALAIELKRRGVPQVVPAAQLRPWLARQRIPLELVDRRMAVRLGRELRADYAVAGEVLEYDLRQVISEGKVRGQEPTVSLQLVLIDVLRENILYTGILSLSQEPGLSLTSPTLEGQLQKAVSQLLATALGQAVRGGSR